MLHFPPSAEWLGLRITPNERKGKSVEPKCKAPNKKPSTAYVKLKCRCQRCCEWESNRTKIREQAGTTQKQKIQQYIKSLKKDCADCGWNEIPTLLEFHHENLSEHSSIGRIRSINRLIDELKKGVFLCPICHRKRHYNPITDRLELFNNDLGLNAE